MQMRQLELLRSRLGTGVVVVALCFQMLPFFFLMVVAAYALGVTGGGMLIITPVFFLAMIVAACWLASKRSRRAFERPPPRPRKTARRPVPGDVVLIKTRAERYQDLKEIIGGVGR